MPTGRTRVSSCHQLTIPIGPYRAAELSVGDRLEVMAEGPGEVRLSRIQNGIDPQGDNLAPVPGPKEP